MSQHPDEHDQARHAATERWIYGGIRVLDGKRAGNPQVDNSGRFHVSDLATAHEQRRLVTESRPTFVGVAGLSLAPLKASPRPP
jgi:hypothetical protein